MNDMAAAALDYAHRGWPVFPLKAGGKTPANGHGFKDATADPSEVAALWASFPNANIGIATGTIGYHRGLWVLDIDGEQGEASLANLVYGFGPVTDYGESVATATTGKGRHLYFSSTTEAIRSRTSKTLAPGLDIRADGGYVVAPPSLHPNGTRYRWLDPDNRPGPAAYWLTDIATGRITLGRYTPEATRRPFSAPEPAPPSRLRAVAPEGWHLSPPEDPRRAASARTALKRMAELPEGDRNAGTFRYACLLRRIANTEAEWEELRDEALDILPYGPGQDGDPFDRAEAARIFRDAPKYAELGDFQLPTPYRKTATNRLGTMRRGR